MRPKLALHTYIHTGLLCNWQKTQHITSENCKKNRLGLICRTHQYYS